MLRLRQHDLGGLATPDEDGGDVEIHDGLKRAELLTLGGPNALKDVSTISNSAARRLELGREIDGKAARRLAAA